MTLKYRPGDVLIAEDKIAARVRDIGEQISTDYAGKEILMVCVLKGASIFTADLARVVSIPATIDFMRVSSYGAATKTSGVVRIIMDLEQDLTDKHVILVEDIVDSGLTLNYLRKYLEARNPQSVAVAAMFCKEGTQRDVPKVEYLGFMIPDRFVVGYGLDAGEEHRGLPDLCGVISNETNETL